MGRFAQRPDAIEYGIALILRGKKRGCSSRFLHYYGYGSLDRVCIRYGKGNPLAALVKPYDHELSGLALGDERSLDFKESSRVAPIPRFSTISNMDRSFSFTFSPLFQRGLEINLRYLNPLCLPFVKGENPSTNPSAFLTPPFYQCIALCSPVSIFRHEINPEFRITFHARYLRDETPKTLKPSLSEKAFISSTTVL